MSDHAMSPVIGVILMVAITVIFAAVIALGVFGLVGTLDTPDFSGQEEIHMFRVTSLGPGLVRDGDRFYLCKEDCGWIKVGDDITAVVRPVPVMVDYKTDCLTMQWEIREVLAMTRGSSP